MTVRKRFDRDLWLENDKKARNACEKIFNQFENLTVKPHKSPTKVDLELFLDGEHIANVETEIKRVWKAETFQYESVQFPERKRKFCELEKPTLFIMWNFNCSSYLVVTGSDLIDSPSVEVPNKYVYKGEYFFQVPVNKVYMNDLDSALEKLGLDLS